jgi:hypothetical protein
MFEMMNKLIRPKEYYDNKGTRLVPTFEQINNTLSGISSGVSAGTLNLLSGLTDSAASINTFASSISLLQGSSLSSILTTSGDIVYASASGEPSRLGVTSADMSLVVNSSGVPSWEHAKGFSSDLAAWYGNTKLGAMFQNDETWTSIAGTQSNDATNFKLGIQSLKILESDNTAGLLASKRDSITLDLSILNDNSSSSESDYIYFVFYISDVAAIDTGAGKGISLRFSQDSTYSDTNIVYYDLTSGLATAWNYIKIAKSSFLTSGAGAWDGIQSIRISWYSLDNYQNEYISFQLVQLIKKDPLSSYPNPFQRFGVRDFAINAGEWFVGMEFEKIVWRDIAGIDNRSSLVSTKAYMDFAICMDVKANSATIANGPSWRIDSNNIMYMRIAYNVLEIKETNDGVTTVKISASYNINQYDIIRFVLLKKNNKVTAIVQRNNGLFVVLSYETILATSGYPSIHGINSSFSNIILYSCTTTDHAHHSDVAEVAKSLTNTWNTWTPTLTWTTGTPSSITTIARYTIIGNTVFFNIYISSADGNAATALKISLPVSPKDNNSLISVTSQQLVDTTWANRIAYIDDDDGNGIQFRDFATCTDNLAVAVIVTGQYETDFAL